MLGRHSSGVLAVVAGVVYALTASSSVLGGDNGELATLAARGGVAHPPGYPAYVLWQRLFAWLPASSPAHRAALVTGIAGAAAIWMLYRACVAWGARAETAACVTATFAFSPLMWGLSTEAEVFAPNVFLALAIVALAAPGPPPFGREEARVVLLALTAGVGLANHHSIVLVAPIGLWGIVSALRRCVRPVRFAVGAVGAFMIGLSPYLYVVWCARTMPHAAGLVWGEPATLDGVVHLFLRADYGTTRLAISAAPIERGAHEVALAKSVVTGLLGLPIIALGGAVLAARAGGWRRAPIGLLLASFLFAGPGFVALFNLPAHGIDALVTARFHLLPTALAAVLTALGIDVLVTRAGTKIHARVASYGVPLAIVLGAIRAIVSEQDLAASHRPTTQRYLENALLAAPPEAIVLGDGDDLVSGFMYEQSALARRRDVVFVTPRLLFAEWYARRISDRLGFEIVRGASVPGGAPVLDAAALMDQLVASGRPVLVIDAALAAGVPSYPMGPLIRIVAGRRDVLDPIALEKDNLALYDRFSLDETSPPAGSWGALRWESYARPWLALAAAFERGGDRVRAAACRDRARRFLPRQ